MNHPACLTCLRKSFELPYLMTVGLFLNLINGLALLIYTYFRYAKPTTAHLAFVLDSGTTLRRKSLTEFDVAPLNLD